MNKKGFTLIELLAVIVILAIIAVIATPTILGVIEKARKGSAESSALGYIDAVEKQIMINEVDTSSKSIKDRVYSIQELKELGVTVKGTEPSNGTIEIKNGEVKDYVLGIDKYVVEKGKATKVSNINKYENGYSVYYNPTTGEKCIESEAVSTTGTKSGCMKWYTYNDSEGSGAVNLILDHNTTAKVAWNSSGNNTEMKEVLESLTNDTNNWKVPARLITAEEVNKITGKTDWTNTSSWYCLESRGHDVEGMPYCNNSGTFGWLYDHTYCVEGSNDWKCLNNDTATYGYWTSTTYGNAGSGSYVWYVSRFGSLGRSNAYDTVRGVRPVITISKDIIK